jgi:hypothetical protein
VTTTEQRDFLAAGIARAIVDNYFLGPFEAKLVADVFGFASGAQVLEQQRLLRANPQAVSHWLQVSPQQVNPYLF